jgi:AP-3 complex subunit delta
VQLFTFIRADLASFRPEEGSITSLPIEGTSQNPAHPKSLLLINPLFAAYELNSVNIFAQDSIPVPESLDLDAWIVPPPREFTLHDATAVDGPQGDELPSTKKKAKGKGKSKGKGKEKAPKPAVVGSQSDLIPSPSPGPSETEEDKIEREKAS